ncbi:MauE/DoxX family redox-associated membrane protein [Marinactinospora thermotolerans]|uniref:Predicted membrane protein n=1 Tax=Marinactinospora thermotolerans DSM 45154 TaxID=1122192 RepID=A0A1T4KRQ1_9ACTN|nr:MauE/DoxX family redox-associated membrane protein [Marinactinospora thermotolerans]SJZ45095.1 Predicted membrane protein [Marinactinospora thermotolerans DSM 45154]
MSTEIEPHPPAEPEPRPQDGAGRSRWQTVQPWITLVARLALVGVLGYAGISKMGAPALSVQAVEAYELFPDGVNQFIGYTLPFFEVALALLLLVGLASRYTAAVAALLMVVFIAGIISAWARGLTIDCGCFGTGGQVAPGETRYGVDILRDIGFAALAGIVMLWPRSPFSLDSALGLYSSDERSKD